MKVLHVCYSDQQGGAARAAYRLHSALLESGIKSDMLVVDKRTSDTEVITIPKNIRIRIKINSYISTLLLKLRKSCNTSPSSLSLFRSGLASYINKLDYDIINLHWVNGDMISIKEISQLELPIVWTLHDMWPFLGVEHYERFGEKKRYLMDYSSSSKSDDDHGLDLERIVYKRKKKTYLKSKILTVSPSHWMKKCVDESFIFSSSKNIVIPNCVSNQFKPVDKFFCRRLLSLPIDKKIILFGAMASTSDLRKGFHLLKDAIELFKDNDYEICVFGSKKAREDGVNYLGSYSDDLSLSLIYNSADVFVAPSLQDNLPNTINEALACGIPCVGFDIGGISDLIIAGKNGEFIEDFSGLSIFNAVSNVLSDDYNKENVANISNRYRGCKTISEQYISIYKEKINNE